MGRLSCIINTKPTDVLRLWSQGNSSLDVDLFLMKYPIYVQQ